MSSKTFQGRRNSQRRPGGLFGENTFFCGSRLPSVFSLTDWVISGQIRAPCVFLSSTITFQHFDLYFNNLAQAFGWKMSRTVFFIYRLLLCTTPWTTQITLDTPSWGDGPECLLLPQALGSIPGLKYHAACAEYRSMPYRAQGFPCEPLKELEIPHQVWFLIKSPCKDVWRLSTAKNK